MEKFDRANLRVIREDLERAMAEVMAKHNVVIDIGAFRYTEADFRCKLNVRIAGVKPKTVSEENNAYAKYLRQFPELEAGMTFKLRGNIYTVVGARPRAELNIVLKKNDNKLLATMKYDDVIKLVGKKSA